MQTEPMAVVVNCEPHHFPLVNDAHIFQQKLWATLTRPWPMTLQFCLHITGLAAFTQHDPRCGEGSSTRIHGPQMAANISWTYGDKVESLQGIKYDKSDKLNMISREWVHDHRIPNCHVFIYSWCMLVQGQHHLPTTTYGVRIGPVFYWLNINSTIMHGVMIGRYKN